MSYYKALLQEAIQLLKEIAENMSAGYYPELYKRIKKFVNDNNGL